MSQSTNPNQMTSSTPVVPSTNTPSGASSIPDLLKIGAIASNTAIDIETAILEPVTQSDTHCRFVLQNKGILHSHSKIEFELLSPGDATGAAPETFLPSNVGIHSLIQRATLRVGTKTICEVDDYNHFSNYKSQFLSPETELEREQHLGGRIANSMEFNYTDQLISAAAANANGATEQSDTSAKDMMISNGMENEVGGISGNDPGTVEGVRAIQPHQYLKRISGDGAGAEVITQNQANCPRFQISISDLFPFLKTNQLPIYMFKEPINFEFVFSHPGNLITGQVTQRAVGTANVQVSVNTASTRMIADHMYYPQEMMASFVAANRNMQFQYVDYRLSKFSRTQAELASVSIRNIGGAGRIISKVIFGVDDATRGAVTNPNGPYLAVGANRTYTAAAGAGATDFNGDVSFNLKYNEQFLFPIDVNNVARCYHNIVQAEGQTPFTTREVYSNEGQSLSANTYGPFTNMDIRTRNSQFWNAFRLNRGERVNSRGIELYFKIATTGANPMVQRCWLETLKMAQLKDGYLEVQDA